MIKALLSLIILALAQPVSPAMIKALLSLIILALAQPVSPVRSDEWLSYPCGSGGLDPNAAVVESAGENVLRIELPGWMDCAADPKFRFAVATFAPRETQAYVYPGMLGSYTATGHDPHPNCNTCWRIV